MYLLFNKSDNLSLIHTKLGLDLTINLLTLFNLDSTKCWPCSLLFFFFIRHFGLARPDLGAS